ncbi:MAG: DUF3888 domain-containing protein [Bacillaceae bacterium]|nr:DUF3888 domain-containing protein [Bacillaceae bacterium]
MYKMLTAITLCLVVLTFLFPAQAEPAKPPPESTEELYHDLFITLLHPHIKQAVAAYYTKAGKRVPMVYPYMVELIEAERILGYRSFLFRVTLDVTSVVGPHHPVGRDRLTFKIGTGRIQLEQFKHLESYDPPPRGPAEPIISIRQEPYVFRKI